MLTLPCHTLPYLPWKTFYRLVLRPPMGPVRIPELTARLQKISKTTPIMEPLPSASENTHLCLPTITHSVSDRTSASEAHQPWSQVPNQKNPGDHPWIKHEVTIPQVRYTLGPLQNWIFGTTPSPSEGPIVVHWLSCALSVLSKRILTATIHQPWLRCQQIHSCKIQRPFFTQNREPVQCGNTHKTQIRAIHYSAIIEICSREKDWGMPSCLQLDRAGNPVVSPRRARTTTLVNPSFTEIPNSTKQHNLSGKSAPDGED